tara:strand:- start:196232 stop:196489 length:258 start_codon:yes stop_codon:yes gene_type:complete
MDARQAKENNKTHHTDTIDGMFATFTRDVDYTVRRASTTGHTGTVVTVEAPAEHKAEQYLLEKGYTIIDKGTGAYNGDTWFRIRW